MSLGRVAQLPVDRGFIHAVFVLVAYAIALCGCTLLSDLTGEPAPSSPEAPEIMGDASASSAAWDDASAVMAGICFAAANDAAGRVFVLRDQGELDTFFGLADNSQLCPRPVARGSFDFSAGRILIGVWSAGVGCTASHDVRRFARDDMARTLTIRLRLMIEGDCPYELVRPFWIGVPSAADYAVNLVVVGGGDAGAGR
jgi:hypothetical protein